MIKINRATLFVSLLLVTCLETSASAYDRNAASSSQRDGIVYTVGNVFEMLFWGKNVDSDYFRFVSWFGEEKSFLIEVHTNTIARIGAVDIGMSQLEKNFLEYTRLPSSKKMAETSEAYMVTNPKIVSALSYIVEKDFSSVIRKEDVLKQLQVSIDIVHKTMTFNLPSETESVLLQLLQTKP